MFLSIIPLNNIMQSCSIDEPISDFFVSNLGGKGHVSDFSQGLPMQVVQSSTLHLDQRVLACMQNVNFSFDHAVCVMWFR